MKNEGAEVVVYDFDGTATKPDAEGSERFTRAHQEGLARMIEASPEWVAERYEATRRDMLADPCKYAWQVSGYAVGPALVDVCVQAQVCAQVLLAELGQPVQAWGARLEELYHQNYMLSRAPIRPEFLETLETWRDRGVPCYIVTSSATTKVQERIRELGHRAAWLVDRVYGHARKHVVTPGDPGHVEPHTNFPDLDRPVHLHKGHYHRVLQAILDRHDASWSDLVMTGDIAELDLALPVTLGARGFLMNSDTTPAYERVWASSLHRPVQLIHDLRETLA